MEAMAKMPDKVYDLAIVDPPYFSGPDKEGFYGAAVSNHGVKRKNYKPIEKWAVPDEDYLRELKRVSQNQIIWGINYYTFIHGPGRIIWDKCNDNSTYSNAEIASCSIIQSVKIFRYLWRGMMQGKNTTDGTVMRPPQLNQQKIHPTEKPIELYKWLLKNYAKPGDKILDTHGGSMSIAIACHDMGFDLDLWELDNDYYKAGKERFEKHCRQAQLFSPQQVVNFKQEGLL